MKDGTVTSTASIAMLPDRSTQMYRSLEQQTGKE